MSENSFFAGFGANGVDISIEPHCYDDGQGLYTIKLQTRRDGRVLDTYIGVDAVSFLRRLKNAVEGV